MKNLNLAPGYWLIAQLPGGKPWLLNMGTPYKDMAAVDRAIAWQKIGDGQFDGCKYVPCRYDSLRCVFVDAEGTILTPDRGPYTGEAWNGFLAKMATTAGKL